MNIHLSLLDLNQEEDCLKPIANNLFTKVYPTGLTGCGLVHTSYLAGEHREHSFRQHGIVVHLKPEQNSLRRLGGSLQKEDADVGDIAIIPTKINHWQKVETEVAENIILTIEPEVISSIAHEVIDPDRVELIPTFAKSDPLIQHLAIDLKANLDSNNCDRLYAESLFNLLSTHLLRHYASSQFMPKDHNDGLSTYKLKLAKNYINDNLEYPIKLNDIASLLGISQFYFSHLFKKSTGIAPYKYVIQQRVAKAKNLIKDSNLSLIEIAYECGFSSQSQMTQHFRKYIGITPKVYQIRVEKNKCLNQLIGGNKFS